MSPDPWERRPVPIGPGYNNAGDGPLSFTVTYDSGPDTLVIGATQPVFVEGTFLGAQVNGEAPDGTPGWSTGISADDVMFDSPSQITLTNAHSYLVGVEGQTNEIQQVDFYNVGPTLIGTWLGSELVTDPTPTPPGVVTSFKSAFFDANNGYISSVCTNIGTMDLKPMYVIQLQGLTSIYGVEITFDNATTLQFTQDNTYIYPYGSGYFAFVDSLLVGQDIQSMQLIDEDLNPVGDPFLPSAIDYWLQPSTFEQVGDDVTITFGNAFPAVAPAYPANLDRITLTGCPSNGGGDGNISIFDPAGPNAGLNPGGMTFIQWDIDAIIVQDIPGLSFTIDIAAVRDGFGGYYAEFQTADFPP